MSIKVICISIPVGRYYQAPFKVGDTLIQSEVPHKDRIYLVLNGINPKSACYIEEYPTGPNGEMCYWSKEHFAPISEIDETEFERNYQKELV